MAEATVVIAVRTAVAEARAATTDAAVDSVVVDSAGLQADSAAAITDLRVALAVVALADHRMALAVVDSVGRREDLAAVVLAVEDSAEVVAIEGVGSVP